MCARVLDNNDGGPCLCVSGEQQQNALLLVLRRTGTAGQINLEATPVYRAVILECVEEVDEIEACVRVIHI